LFAFFRKARDKYKIKWNSKIPHPFFAIAEVMRQNLGVKMSGTDSKGTI
jgi:hypothetical protein